MNIDIIFFNETVKCVLHALGIGIKVDYGFVGVAETYEEAISTGRENV